MRDWKVMTLTNTAQSMTQAFLTRALHEAKRYGENRWVFLREWIQNSRDAKASHIRLSAGIDGDREWIECRDDGIGMTDDEMRRYLFRLYASSKEVDPASVGVFGVGFWSILLYDPDWVLVEACSDGIATAYRLDCRSLDIEAVDPSLQQDGFRVILHRPRHFIRVSELESEIEKHVTAFAGPVQPVPPIPHLKLELNNKPMNRPLPQPQYMADTINNGYAEGFVGFGRKPWVRVYKAGILVRDVTDLHELLPSRGQQYTPNTFGIHPQVVINDDSLTILMDRRSIYEDAHLLAIIEQCEQKLKKKERVVLRSLFPLNRFNQCLWLLDGLKRRWKIASISIVFLVLLSWLIFRVPDTDTVPLTASTVSRALERPQSQTTLDQIFDHWSEPKIDLPQQDPQTWDISVTPAEDLILTVGQLSQFDAKKGLLPAALTSDTAYPELEPAESDYRIRMRISGRNRIVFLPLPTGSALVKSSISLDQGEIQNLMLSRAGSPILTLRSLQETHVSYRARRNHSVQVGSHPSFLEAPPKWDTLIQAQLAEIQTISSLDERVAAVRILLASHLSYARDWQSIRRFNQSDLDWIQKVLSVGRGDCDVMNGMCALMLRSVGIPAYVEVGLPMHGQGTPASLHAWTNYYLDGWHHIDVSSQSQNHEPLGSGPAPNPIPVATQTDVSSQSPNPSTRSSIPYIALALTISGLIVLWLKRRRPANPRPDLEAALVLGQILEHDVNSDNQHGNMAHYAPVLRLLNGRHVSLRQLQQYAKTRSPLMGRDEHALIKRLHDSVWVLDRDCPYVQRLRPYLPDCVDLDDILRFDSPFQMPSCLELVKRVLSSLDKKTHLVMLENDQTPIDLQVRLKDGLHHWIGFSSNSRWINESQAIYDIDAKRGALIATVELISRTLSLRLHIHRVLKIARQNIEGASHG